MSRVGVAFIDCSVPIQPFHTPRWLLARRQLAQWAEWRRTEAACDDSGDAVRTSCRAFQPVRRVAPIVKTAAVVPEEQDFILSSLSPGRAQRRLALAVVLALLVAYFLTEGLLSTIQLGRIDAFVPAYATAMFVTDSITAVLLFAQFSILRSRALLAISNGYLFAALMVIPWMLTFPGVFTPGGLLGAGLQSTSWLYTLWHAGFPMFVIAYALLKDAGPTKRLWRGSAGAAILLSVAMTAVVVSAAAFIVTAGDALLPRINLDPVHFSTLWFYIAGCLALLNVLALTVLWVRRHSVLDLWLMVVISAYVIDLYDRVSRSGPLQRRLVYRPGLRAPVRQSPPVCPAVRDNDALRAAAARGPRPTPRARGAADDRGRSRGHDRSRGQPALVWDDNECRCRLALA